MRRRRDEPVAADPTDAPHREPEPTEPPPSSSGTPPSSLPKPPVRVMPPGSVPESTSHAAQWPPPPGSTPTAEDEARTEWFESWLDHASGARASSADEPVADQPEASPEDAGPVEDPPGPGAVEAPDEPGPVEDPADPEPRADVPSAEIAPTPPSAAASAASAPPLPGEVRVDPQRLAQSARAVVRRALDEDLDVAGDVTTLATVPPEAAGSASLVARESGVVAGLDLVGVVYDQLDPRVEVEPLVADGDRVDAGQPLATVRGSLRSLLTGERTALNLVTHLSGVATRTAAYAEAVAGTGCVVRDTRKTLPGLRLLEKAAVTAGGGANHRVGLSDAVLVKDNHAAAAGGVGAATRAALAAARGLHVQVEVDSLDELEEAVEAGARDVLLDNLDVTEVRRAVARVRELEPTHGRILLEASGGIDLDNARAYAEAGVDRLAVGAVTHSAPVLDVALDLDVAPSSDRRG